MTGYLKVILGSMFSGKTTELIKEYHRHVACEFRCCFVNHKLDNQRYDSASIAHNKLTVDVTANIKRLADIVAISHNYDVFFINEGQFFKDLYIWVDWLVNKQNKKVYVCGLDGDFERKKFGYILDIIPLCDDVIKIKALCKYCQVNEGIFTHRLTGGKAQTVVGVANYIPLCRDCFNIVNQSKVLG
mgnify:FL=1